MVYNESIYWDNLSHNYWKYNKKFPNPIVGLIIVLIPLLLCYLLSILTFYINIKNLLISLVISTLCLIFISLYIAYEFLKFLQLEKERTWEYTSIYHPDVSLQLLMNGIKQVLTDNNYNYKCKLVKFIGNRYQYFYIENYNVIIRLFYKKKANDCDYDIYIGPKDSIDDVVVNKIKRSLSRWARKKIRPIIGTYKIFDSDIET